MEANANVKYSLTFSSLYAHGLDSTESQGEEYAVLFLAVLGVTSIDET